MGQGSNGKYRPGSPGGRKVDSPSLRDSFSNSIKQQREEGRSDAINNYSCVFDDERLESRYIKSTASSFRETRFHAVVVATVAALVVNLLVSHVPPSSSAMGGVFSWSLWANAPLNLSLCLLVVGLYSLEPRKSTTRMIQLQRITAGLLLVVTVCIIYTACTTLRGSAGAGAARLQRATELNIGGLLFLSLIMVSCETIAVAHVAVTCCVWGIGWILTLWGIGSWGHRAGGWCVLEGLCLLGTKWLIEDQRRQRWLMRLYLEGELKTLGEFSLAGIRSNLIDESSEGGDRSLRSFHRTKKLSDPMSDGANNESPPLGESLITDWIFGRPPMDSENPQND